MRRLALSLRFLPFAAVNGEAFSGETIDKGVLETLSDDLNTHAAIVRLQKLAKMGDWGALRASIGFLGFSCDLAKLTNRVELRVSDAQDQAEFNFENNEPRIDESTINHLIARRKEARTAKNWAEADRLRDELAALGVAIKDNKDGTTTWEPKR